MFYQSVYYIQLLSTDFLEFHECIEKVKYLGKKFLLVKCEIQASYRISKLINGPKDLLNS